LPAAALLEAERTRAFGRLAGFFALAFGRAVGFLDRDGLDAAVFFVARDAPPRFPWPFRRGCGIRSPLEIRVHADYLMTGITTIPG
jgi:hypothetical protein